jgi:hypothetical protein
VPEFPLALGRVIITRDLLLALLVIKVEVADNAARYVSSYLLGSSIETSNIAIFGYVNRDINRNGLTPVI